MRSYQPIKQQSGGQRVLSSRWYTSLSMPGKYGMNFYIEKRKYWTEIKKGNRFKRKCRGGMLKQQDWVLCFINMSECQCCREKHIRVNNWEAGLKRWKSSTAMRSEKMQTHHQFYSILHSHHTGHRPQWCFVYSKFSFVSHQRLCCLPSVLQMGGPIDAATCSGGRRYWWILKHNWASLLAFMLVLLVV